MGSGRQTLSAICRPQAEPISDTYLSISVSMRLEVRPVSSIECGSAGRNASSFRIDASKLPEAPGVVELLVSEPASVPAVIIAMLRKDQTLASVRIRGQTAPFWKHRSQSGSIAPRNGYFAGR